MFGKKFSSAETDKAQFFPEILNFPGLARPMLRKGHRRRASEFRELGRNAMTSFTRNDIQRITVSAIGALLVSTACIGVAVFPARAAEVTVSTAADWQAEVERRIDNAMQTPNAQSDRPVVAEVVMHFDDKGSFLSASLGKSSGLDRVDQEALRVANSIRYPALPVHLQGKPRNVGMQIVFGNNSETVNKQTDKARTAATALAAKADANRAEARIATQPTS
jgi:hypothetical protein